jgi:hypothetical protein
MTKELTKPESHSIKLRITYPGKNIISKRAATKPTKFGNLMNPQGRKRLLLTGEKASTSMQNA